MSKARTAETMLAECRQAMAECAGNPTLIEDCARSVRYLERVIERKNRKKHYRG